MNMGMIYQEGTVYEKGIRVKKWYGQFRVYQRDPAGNEVKTSKKVILGLKSPLRKHEARARLREIIRLHNRNAPAESAILAPKETLTFDQFVKEKYLPLRRGRWSIVTKEKTEYEINRYLVQTLGETPLPVPDDGNPRKLIT